MPDVSKMDWPQYAAHLETQARESDETNTKLKQEIRGLQRQLVGAGSQRDPEGQLAKAKEELTASQTFYVNNLNRLQQLLDHAIAEQRDMRNRLEAANRELAAVKADNQRLNAIIGNAAAKARQAPAQNAVSLQDRCAMLERQLKIQQSVNAELQSHSNAEKKKQAWKDDEKDDEEVYSAPEPAVKPERRSTTDSSILPQADGRSDNYARGAKATHVARATAAKKPAPSPGPTPRAKSIVFREESSSSPPTQESNEQGQCASHSIDLTMSDAFEPPTTPATTNAPSGRLPARRSLHDNIIVAEQIPEPVPVPPPTGLDVIPPPTLKPVSLAPSNKRKRDAQEPAPSTRSKRRRSNEEEIRDEVANLTINARGFEEPATPRPKRKDSCEESDAEASDPDDETFEGIPNFRFTAICNYDDNSEIDERYPSSDLDDCVEALWERIKGVEDLWQEAAGDYWQHDFERRKSSASLVCVTQKCRKRATNWRPGFAGKYACVDCVKGDNPCFTYVPGPEGGFRLLPLRKQDRLKEVKEGKETRWWIND